MRLANLLLRGGHLSEREVIEICTTGQRPAHMDRCDICADRALELGRWLDDVRLAGLAEADAVFSSERLAAQQAQILRRLEQLDQPARVIAFPSFSRTDDRAAAGRRVAPAWVAIAAAAGLLFGVVGGQLSARLSLTKPAAPIAAAQPSVDAADLARLSQIDQEESPTLPSVSALNQLTPHQIGNGEGSIVLAAYNTAGPGR